MTVVEVSIISVHTDPAPLFSGTAAISKDRVCPGGGRMAHTAPEAHGSVTENTYDRDRGFPLRTITQQLQEEAKHLSVLDPVQ